MDTTAAVLRSADGPLTLETLHIDALRPHEVLVRVVGSGICHTDLGVIAGHEPEQSPIVLGHEGSGIVDAVGSEVTTLAPGDHVVLSYNFCGQCDNCVEHNVPMHCRQFVELNLVGARIDGSTALTHGDELIRGHFFGQSSWAAHAVANEQNCVKVSRDLPLELLGPLGCGIQTGAGAVLNTLRPDAGSSIVIFGVGSVGLAALLAAVAADCGTIIAVDIQQSRLEQATKLGATHTINSATEDVVARVRDITGAGAQYSVDCIALPPVLRSALECLQSPGVCATVGFQGMSNEITLDQGHLLFGRTLVGVIEGDAIPAEFVTRMIDLYQAGRFPFDELITTFPFERINDALDAVHRGEVTKAVLTFDTTTGPVESEEQ
ncbi:NAD(P)-dependent alcohol dehydrogenase [Rhodococcus sp. NPDC127530]|uniref:NAD(P)-dependent alcohol dehydrogenase n=1 Tax=unclassified Rhodococcus (in: high G+C Gram-positive bacteria) TaxID=192944 RepID=UPI00362AEB3D